MNPGWHTIGIRLVYDWHTVVYGDVVVVYDGIRWYTVVCWYGIRWHTVVYGSHACVVYDWYTIGIRLAYGGIRVTCGYGIRVGIRLVYDWHTMVYGAPLGMVYDRYTIWYTDVVLHISDWKVR